MGFDIGAGKSGGKAIRRPTQYPNPFSIWEDIRNGLTIEQANQIDNMVPFDVNDERLLFDLFLAVFTIPELVFMREAAKEGILSLAERKEL